MARPIPNTVNVVPTPMTRAVASRMLKTATETSGAHAVVRHLESIHPSQLAALLGVVLDASRKPRHGRKQGRLPVPDQFSREEMLRGYRLFRGGDTSDFAKEAHRQYQRQSMRRLRAARRRDREAQTLAAS